MEGMLFVDMLGRLLVPQQLSRFLSHAANVSLHWLLSTAKDFWHGHLLRGLLPDKHSTMHLLTPFSLISILGPCPTQLLLLIMLAFICINSFKMPLKLAEHYSSFYL